MLSLEFFDRAYLIQTLSKMAVKCQASQICNYIHHAKNCKYVIIFSLPQKILKSTGECVVIEGEIKGIMMTNAKKENNRGYGAVLVCGGIVRGRRVQQHN